jgi:hypothetical protein
MKLQKRLSRKVGKKEYVKWVVTLPPDDVKKAGWHEGQDLKAILINEDILIKKAPKK